MIFSLNGGRSRSAWQGFSLRWWTSDPTDSLLHDAAIRTAMLQTFRLSIGTVLIAVPLGTLFAIGIDRWHGRPARAANFTMLLSFVVPEIILGVSLYILFTSLFANAIQLGTKAQLLGLIAFQISYPVIIVRARLLSIGPEYEEAAMDLGATPSNAIRRVLLPLLAPAILASVALVFADTVDDFVTVAALSGPCEQRDARAEDLLGRTLLAHAGGQRGRHDDADHDPAGDRRRAALLPTGQPRPGHRGRLGVRPALALDRRPEGPAEVGPTGTSPPLPLAV